MQVLLYERIFHLGTFFSLKYPSTLSGTLTVFWRDHKKPRWLMIVLECMISPFQNPNMEGYVPVLFCSHYSCVVICKRNTSLPVQPTLGTISNTSVVLGYTGKKFKSMTTILKKEVSVITENIRGAELVQCLLKEYTETCYKALHCYSTEQRNCATCLTMLLRHNLHEELHVTQPKMNMSSNVLVHSKRCTKQNQALLFTRIAASLQRICYAFPRGVTRFVNLVRLAMAQQI